LNGEQERGDALQILHVVHGLKLLGKSSGTVPKRAAICLKSTR
jgi:hypothetical protein